MLLDDIDLLPIWFLYCRGREREVPLMAIEALRKTRLQKCRDVCVAEDVDSSIHVVEVRVKPMAHFRCNSSSCCLCRDSHH